MPARSSPSGRLPNGVPGAPAVAACASGPSLVVQKASATAVGACRASSAACRVTVKPGFTGQLPCLPLRTRPVAHGLLEILAQARGRGGASRVARRQVNLGEHSIGRVRCAGERPQYVQGRDVARALPDGVQRRIAQQPGHGRVVLDIPVAAEALQGFGGDHGRPLADPELGGRQRDTQQGCLGRVTARRPVSRPREPQGQGGPGLGLKRQVGDDAGHGRVIDQPGAEGEALTGVVSGDDTGLADRGRAAEHAVEPGRAHHADDRRNTAPELAYRPGNRLVVLDLAGGIRGITQLVLEPLDVHGVPAAVRQHFAPRGSRKHDKPSGALEASTRNRSHIGAEQNHLCPVSR